jgi:hypothetical protein
MAAAGRIPARPHTGKRAALSAKRDLLVEAVRAWSGEMLGESSLHTMVTLGKAEDALLEAWADYAKAEKGI